MRSVGMLGEKLAQQGFPFPSASALGRISSSKLRDGTRDCVLALIHMQSFTLAVLRVVPFLSILSILWFNSPRWQSLTPNSSERSERNLEPWRSHPVVSKTTLVVLRDKMKSVGKMLEKCQNRSALRPILC